MLAERIAVEDLHGPSETNGTLENMDDAIKLEERIDVMRPVEARRHFRARVLQAARKIAERIADTPEVVFEIPADFVISEMCASVRQGYDAVDLVQLGNRIWLLLNECKDCLCLVEVERQSRMMVRLDHVITVRAQGGQRTDNRTTVGPATMPARLLAMDDRAP